MTEAPTRARRARERMLAALAVASRPCCSARGCAGPASPRAGSRRTTSAGSSTTRWCSHAGGLPYVARRRAQGPRHRSISRGRSPASAAPTSRASRCGPTRGRCASRSRSRPRPGARSGPARRRSPPPLAVLADAHLDSMDANYVTWSQLPTILAMSLGARGRALPDGAARAVGLRRSPERMAGVAMMIKHPTGIVVDRARARGARLWSRDRAATLRVWAVAVALGGVPAPTCRWCSTTPRTASSARLVDALPAATAGASPYAAAGGRSTLAGDAPIEGTLATVALPRAAAGLAAFATAITRRSRARRATVPWPLAIWVAGRPSPRRGWAPVLQGLLPAPPCRRCACSPPRRGACSVARLALRPLAAGPRCWCRSLVLFAVQAAARSRHARLNRRSRTTRRAHRSPATSSPRPPGARDLGVGLAPVGPLRVHRLSLRHGRVQVAGADLAAQRRHLAAAGHPRALRRRAVGRAAHRRLRGRAAGLRRAGLDRAAPRVHRAPRAARARVRARPRGADRARRAVAAPRATLRRARARARRPRAARRA